MTFDDVLERLRDMAGDLTDDKRASAGEEGYDKYSYKPMGLDYFVRETEAIIADLEAVVSEQRKRAAIDATRAEMADGKARKLGDEKFQPLGRRDA